MITLIRLDRATRGVDTVIVPRYDASRLIAEWSGPVLAYDVQGNLIELWRLV